MAEKYYSITPYAYVMNNPLKYIDPDGRLVIFINGLAPIIKKGGSASYWEGFDKAVMKHLNDNKAMYINGAITLNGSGDGLLILQIIECHQNDMAQDMHMEKLWHKEFSILYLKMNK